ncbi:phosphotransferase [Skermania sp. ID1734]|uniref:fructosamine kinase family protein n=1 Tax=Skermania sp. ID1734 TaxID=2597516 RepID=UPI00117D58B4|nr:fructosamine kinase family protein [Skermania sp. ID1734]TSE00976.1 phosphotransferase [Skermania sp. ID1734]
MQERTFRKQRAGVHPDFFPAEAAGLRWLADAGAPVVRVLEVDSSHIVLERVDSAAPRAAAARALGGALARMHDAGVDGRGFGCAPDDFTGQIFIGKRPMSSTEHARWGEFYVTERVLPYLRIAVDASSVTGEQLGDIERACDLVAAGTFDDGEPPSRIHGDLWNGNVMWTTNGAVLIDPAAHGGHRETDLAMLDLFGCAYLDEIIAGYTDQHRLRDGWRARVPVHQLHPLAVHAAGYGAGYGRALHEAAVRTRRLA